MKKIIFTIIIVLCGKTALIGQERGYINDPDGYTNLRQAPSGSSKIIDEIHLGEEFLYYPDHQSNWWKVHFKNQKGFVHKSRIESFHTKVEVIGNFFQEFFQADHLNVEIESMNNEKLFKYLQDYTSASLFTFCQQNVEVQNFLANEIANPIHDLIPINEIYSKILKTEFTCQAKRKILKSFIISKNKTGNEFLNFALDSIKITNLNDPILNPHSTNKNYIDSLNNNSINYYLNHPSIDQYSKFYYLGAFAISDEDLTFAFIDSLFTTNEETKPFYLFIFNSVLEKSDGALSEYIVPCCSKFLEEQPCHFIKIKENQLYSKNYEKWINYSAYSLYFGYNEKSINQFFEPIQEKVNSNCQSYKMEVESIKERMIEFIKENE